MNFQLPIHIPTLLPSISYASKICLFGSCFTEHMYGFFKRHKFSVLQNSHGIIFNVKSVCKALTDVVQARAYTANDLFLLDEYYHSWFHHSAFSSLSIEQSLERINKAIQQFHEYLSSANYLIITLGSAYAYRLQDSGIYVSNNHRAPASWFDKELLTIDDMFTDLTAMQAMVRAYNPHIQFIYTISPVRHSRDGVIENNRSKARLIETVHQLTDAYYFPAYELVIDVLRDYRFYDIDLVHPNYPATAYVWEQFVKHCMHPDNIPIMKQLAQVYQARQHQPKDKRSKAHQQFLQANHMLCAQLQQAYPFLDLQDELKYFGTNEN